MTTTTRSIARPILWGMTCLAIMMLSAGRIGAITSRYSDNPNEGWNAWHAARALGAGPLYPSPEALIGNNYPPLSFYLVGWLGRIVGDPIIAGRFIALVSLLTVAGLIVAIVGRFAARASAAPWAAAALFLGLNVTQFRSYLATNDPQWLAHALAMGGFALLIPWRADAAPTRGRVMGAALLMLGAGMVKHNIVALPIAATLWIALRHRALLLPWLSTALGGLAVAALLCHALYGPAMFADILMADRQYSWTRMAYRIGAPLVIALPLLIAARRLPLLRRSDSRIDLLLIAVAVAIPIGILQQTGQGVVRNAFFEAAIALCLATGVALARWEVASRDRLGSPMLWMAAPFVVLVPLAAVKTMRESAQRPRLEAAWTRMEARIAAIPGPVACQTPALCVWAGKGAELDFFLYGQRVLVRRNASALLHAIGQRRIAAIEIDPVRAVLRPGEMANPLPALIRQRYRSAFSTDDGRQLLMPPVLVAPQPTRLATAS